MAGFNIMRVRDDVRMYLVVPWVAAAVNNITNRWIVRDGGREGAPKIKSSASKSVALFSSLLTLVVMPSNFGSIEAKMLIFL